MPSLADLDDSTLILIGACAAGMIVVCALEFLIDGRLGAKAFAAATSWAATAIAGPLQFGWPADTSFVLGGGAFAVVMLGGRILGWR